MLVQQFLRNGGTLADLFERFAIKAKRHGQHPNLVLLKYSQIDSPFAEQIVRECRGVILDEAANWRVVARAFDKFFNYGEGHAATIDWSTARVQEKVDGSLCMLYYYKGDWHVATTGTPDASGVIGPLERQFQSLFWEAWAESRPRYQPVPDPLEPQMKEYTFLFELTSPHNRVVVEHKSTRLTCLGARHTASMAELPAADASAICSVPPVRSFALQSFEDVINTFQEFSPLGMEGYVVVDAQFRRVKVKHPGYVALHHAKDGLTTRAFVEIARSGEVPEVVAAFPEFATELEKIRERYVALVTEVSDDYNRLSHYKSQKEFAFEALKTRCAAALFQKRAGKVASTREFLQNMPVDKLAQLLGLTTSNSEKEL